MKHYSDKVLSQGKYPAHLFTDSATAHKDAWGREGGRRVQNRRLRELPQMATISPASFVEPSLKMTMCMSLSLGHVLVVLHFHKGIRYTRGGGREDGKGLKEWITKIYSPLSHVWLSLGRVWISPSQRDFAGIDSCDHTTVPSQGHTVSEWVGV